jgi:hypothetical protein
MKTKLALTALALAVLATPALAASKHQPQVQSSQSQSYEGLWNSNTAPYGNVVGVYPNGAIRSGSAASRESGNEENVIR